jgi:hypothetical protein
MSSYLSEHLLFITMGFCHIRNSLIGEKKLSVTVKESEAVTTVEHTVIT